MFENGKFPHEFIGYGAMDKSFLYELHGQFPYEFKAFGDLDEHSSMNP